MCSSKKYFGFALLALIIQLSLITSPNCLIAQTDFFPLGLWNYDICGPEHTVNEPNEMARIDGLHGNYFTSMSLLAQPGMIDTCNDRNSTNIIMLITLGRDDTTPRRYYPVMDYGYEPENSMLARYISDNEVGNIQMALIDTFINRVYTRYQTNHAGIGAIQVAHQGCMDQQNHFEFIRHACHCIQDSFGDNVQSTVVHSIFHWDGGSSLSDFFSYMGDDLDVYQHENYPFFVQDTVPPYTYTDAPYIGNGFQGKVDTMIMSYQQTLDALNSSTNRHTKLEGIFQTFECTNETYHVHWRRPTQAEIWLQAFVALSRNAKGVHSYVYRSHYYGGISYEAGLIDSLTRDPNQPTYAHVADLYTHLSILGPRILNLDVNDTFTWDDTRHQYIQAIEGDTADGSHETIEVSIFDEYDGNDYFMLINRRCSRDNTGTEAFPQHISLTLDTTLTGSYKIRDLYSDEIFVTNNKTFQNIELLAGRGRVFELTQAYPSDISGTVYYYSQVWMVSDALMLLGSGNPADTTNATGNYEFANILPGNAHLTPTKEDDQRDGITGSDALLLLRYLAFLATLTEDQQFAADVTEDGSVSGSDAQALLRYLAFYPDGIGSTGQWRFDPPDTSWLLLDDAEADFKAFLLGDVNGGWGPISRADSIGTLADVEIIIAAPEKNKDGLFEIPIKVNHVKEPLYTFLLSISYDSKYLAFQATGQTESTEKFMVVSNGTDPGIVHLAMAGISGIKDDGEIVRLLFKGAMADLAEKDLALKLTRAIINDYDILKGNDGTISLPKRQVEQELTLIPDHYRLNQNYPNPFNPETEIRYQLPEAAHVNLSIYNLLGQKIRTLIDRNMQAGFHSVKWDGTNDAGAKVPSSVYLYSFKTNQFSDIKKMLLLQ